MTTIYVIIDLVSSTTRDVMVSSFWMWRLAILWLAKAGLVDFGIIRMSSEH
jgi:hypothetical protein